MVFFTTLTTLLVGRSTHPVAGLGMRKYFDLGSKKHQAIVRGMVRNKRPKAVAQCVSGRDCTAKETTDFVRALHFCTDSRTRSIRPERGVQ